MSYKHGYQKVDDELLKSRFYLSAHHHYVVFESKYIYKILKLTYTQ